MDQQLKTQLYKYYLFVFFSGFQLFSAVLVPFFTQWGGITLFQAQLLQAWFLLWVFLLEVPTGVFADLAGYRKSLILGAAVMVPATLIYGSIPNFYLFALGEFIFALAIAFMSGADEAWLKHLLDSQNASHRMKHIIGRAESLKYISMMLAALTGGIVADQISLNAPMLLTSVSATITTLVALSMATTKHPDISSQVNTNPSQKFESVWGYLSLGFTRLGVEVSSSIGFLSRHHQLRRLSLNLVAVSTAAYFVIWYYQPLLTLAGVNLRYFGLFHSLLVGFEIMVSANYQRLETWIGSSNRYLKFSALTTSLGFFVVALYPHLLTVVVFLALSGGFGLTRLQFAVSHFHELVPAKRRASVRSALSMYRRLGTFVASPILGYVATKSLGLALLICGMLPLVVVFSRSLSEAVTSPKQSD